MKKESIKIVVIILSLLFTVLSVGSCAKVQEGADLVASFVKEKPSEDSKTGSEGGLIEAIKEAGEPAPPTPPPSQSSVFTQSLKEVLLKAVSQSEELTTMQLDMLLDPSAKVDNTRSSSTTMIIKLAGEKDDEKLTLTSAALHDTASGDASFTLSASEGEETAQSGGVYFTGNDVLIKRADSDKKMVNYPLLPEQASSFKLLSPIERLTRVLSGDRSEKKQSGEWAASIDEYIKTILQTAQESDFSAGEEQAQLLNQQQSFPSVTLDLKGEKAHELLNGLLTLIEQDSNITSLLNSMEEEENTNETEKLTELRKDLDALTADEITTINMGMTVYSNDEEALGAKIHYTIKGETVELSMLFYKKNYERHNELSMKLKDGSSLLFMSKNLSAGGDNYKGESSLSVKEKDTEDTTTMLAQSTSTITDTQFSTEIEFSTTAKSTNDQEQKAESFSGKVSWSQTKNAASGSSGHGTGTCTMDINDETQKLTFDISLEQVYQDITVDAPQFIESAGLIASDRDDLLEKLDVDKEEYEKAPIMQRALMTLLILIM